MTTNLNPVKMVMLVKEDPLLVDVIALEKGYRVMDLLCEQCVKQQDMNEGNDPTVFSVLTQAPTAQMVLMDTEYCAACGEKCSFCKMVVYCGPTCQRLHWFTHKRQRKTPVSQRASRQPKLRELFNHVDDNDVVDAASSMLALCLGLSKCALQNRPSDDHSEASEDPPCTGKD